MPSWPRLQSSHIPALPPNILEGILQAPAETVRIVGVVCSFVPVGSRCQMGGAPGRLSRATRFVSMAATTLRASLVRFLAQRALRAPNGFRPFCGFRTRQISARTSAGFTLIGFRSSCAAKLREDTRKGMEVLVGQRSYLAAVT